MAVDPLAVKAEFATPAALRIPGSQSGSEAQPAAPGDKARPPVPSAGKPEQSGAQQPSAERVQEALPKLNALFDTLNVQVRFSVHKATKEIMVKVVNVETGDVIREIPPEKILDMVASMLEMVGVLVDEKV